MNNPTRPPDPVMPGLSNVVTQYGLLSSTLQRWDYRSAEPSKANPSWVYGAELEVRMSALRVVDDIPQDARPYRLGFVLLLVQAYATPGRPLVHVTVIETACYQEDHSPALAGEPLPEWVDLCDAVVFLERSIVTPLRPDLYELASDPFPTAEDTL